MHTERAPCEGEGTVGSDSAKTKEQRQPENHQKPGERPGADSPPRPSEGMDPPAPSSQTSSLQSHETIHFCV